MLVLSKKEIFSIGLRSKPTLFRTEEDGCLNPVPEAAYIVPASGRCTLQGDLYNRLCRSPAPIRADERDLLPSRLSARPRTPFHASGMEARRVETRSGSIHDSPAAAGGTPAPPRLIAFWSQILYTFRDNAVVKNIHFLRQIERSSPCHVKN